MVRTSPEPLAAPRSRWLIDSIVAAAYLLVSVGVFGVSELLAPSDEGGDVLLSLLLLLLTATAVLFRRRWTVSMSLIVLFLGLVDTLRGFGVDPLAVPVMLYSLAAYRTLRTTVLLAVGYGIVTVLPIPTDPSYVDALTLVLLLLGGMVVNLSSVIVIASLAVIAILLGVVVKARIRRIDDEAVRLVRDRQHLAQVAALNERDRIGREMHDIVSHTLTVIVTLADGAVAAREEQQSREAMIAASKAARGALQDLRRLLGALRAGEEGASTTPQPDSQALPELVAQFSGAGLPVTLSTTGAPALSAAVSLAIYRITQEGLTNALRYSRAPTHVDVEISYEREGITVTITNDGALTNAVSVGSGQGLAGLHERAALLGGHVTSGTVEGEKWRLRAWIPNHEPDTEGTS